MCHYRSRSFSTVALTSNASAKCLEKPERNLKGKDN